jgi:hypothetical protein
MHLLGVSFLLTRVVERAYMVMETMTCKTSQLIKDTTRKEQFSPKRCHNQTPLTPLSVARLASYRC